VEQDSKLKRLEAAVEATERQKLLGLSELAEIENRRAREKTRSDEIARALEVGTAQEQALQLTLARIVEQQRDLQEQLATAQAAKEQLSKELAAEALLLSRLKDDSRDLRAAPTRSVITPPVAVEASVPDATSVLPQVEMVVSSVPSSAPITPQEIPLAEPEAETSGWEAVLEQLGESREELKQTRTASRPSGSNGSRSTTA
jgi:hypothetical protein